MNSNTPTRPVSIPTGVYDLETLKSEAKHLSIVPSRPNIRRLRRAFDLVDNHCIRLIDRFGDIRIYEVNSQFREGHIHLVVSNGVNQCTCEDARKHENYKDCKHDFAVRIYAERIQDLEDYQNWLDWQAEKHRY